MDIESVRVCMLIGMLLIVAVILMPDRFEKPEEGDWVRPASDDEKSKHPKD